MSFRYHAKRNLLLTAALSIVVIASFLNTLPARAATQTLGGNPTESTLTVTVEDSGKMNVTRYVGGAWQNQIYVSGLKGAGKGSALLINGTHYTMGYFDKVGTAATVGSNTKVGNTITTVQTAGGTQIVQTTTYIPGNTYYSLQWEITNTSGASLSDLRLFHGEDTFLQDGDQGAGWWAPSITSIGVRKVINSIEQRMSLQGITTPYAHESDLFSTVYVNGSNDALSNAIDQRPTTDNGYALEWRQASLANGATWTINALESFTSSAAGLLMVIAPISTTCAVGVACDLTYTIVNTSGGSISTPLRISSNQSWGETIVSPTSPASIAPSGSINVVVRVTPPVGTSSGTLGQLTLTVNDGTTDISDIATIISALGPPAAPSITSPSARSHTNTTPTISGTAEANSSVEVTDGGTIICSVTADSLGAWSCGLTTFSGGSHTISVTAANVHGTGTASTRTFTVDTAVPAAPTISSPVAGSRTNTTPSVSGTTDANVTVTVTEGGTTRCTTTSDDSGNWSCTTSALTGGSHTLSVTAVNTLGTSAASTRSFTVDTAVPATPSVSSPVSNAVTNYTPTFSGTADVGSIVTVSEGGTTLCTTTTDANGNWTCTPSTALSGGSHTVDVIATNGFGSTTPTTRSFTVEVPADLEVTQTSSTISLSQLTLTITVRNKGPNAVTGAVLSDTFPTAATGKTWTWTCAGTACPAASGTGNLSATNVTLGSLSLNGTVVLTVTGTLANWSHWSNTASVAVPTGATDSVTSNNSSTIGRYMILLPIIHK
ncbi:MAG: Ig-like domain-containing protein [Chloroflexales bacterium]